MATKAAVRFTAAFRGAGMTYVEALSVSTHALRKVLKEPLRTQLTAGSQFRFREFTYADGKESAPVEFYSDPSMKKEK